MFTIPWALMPWLVTDRRIRLPVVVLFVAMAAVSITVSFQVHYWGPFIAVIWLIITQSIRHLGCVRWGRRPIGAAYMALLPAALAVMLVVCGLERARATPSNTVYQYKACCKLPESIHPMYQRHVAERQLAQTPGRPLVIVRYTPEHDYLFDWVYNRADIDASKLVWAYDMSIERNKELVEYFSDRTVWLAEPDVKPYRLSPYGREGLRPDE